MLISTGSHHAIRIMLDLALHCDEAPIIRQAISDRQGISPDYIAQICGRLNKAGLLKSTMGPEGGYGLSRPVSEISVGEIIHAIEGPPPTVYCIAPGKHLECLQRENCTTQKFLVQLSQVIESFINSVTLEDLCDQSEKLEHVVSFQYEPEPFSNDLTNFSRSIDSIETTQ